jgi:type II secretory ATPase GspE/PulE/Tfp pilus assembly ATPase PilB-like protein
MSADPLRASRRAVLDALRADGAITPEQAEAALREERARGRRADLVLLERGLVDERRHARALAAALEFPFWEGTPGAVDRPLLARIEERFPGMEAPLPYRDAGGSLRLAFGAVEDLPRVLEVANQLGLAPRLAVCPGDRLRALRSALASPTEESAEVLWREGEAELLPDLSRVDADSVELESPDSPIVRFVDRMILRAIAESASDIHIEPLERRVRVRIRVDGVIHDLYSPPRSLGPAILTRIKLISGMNIAERRRPQDGSIEIRRGDVQADVRVSVIPTAAGERAVLRLLDPRTRLRDLEQLGLDEPLPAVEGLLERTHGIFLVTGPTGSGKTTTIYAALNRLNSPGRNIITIEDPVEYRLEGISQLQVRRATGFTFAAGLRSILRQDPDIIFVGEVRDRETAEIAVQAAMTGHLVLSTLHTNDAPGAIYRLIDMGIEPYQVAGALIGALAQRLLRLNCAACSRPYTPPPPELEPFQGFPGADSVGELVRGSGCSACRGTGFKGRTGIFELMLVDEQVIAFLRAPSVADDLRQRLIAAGLTPLEHHGWRKVLQGRTTPEELLRVVKDR